MKNTEEKIEQYRKRKQRHTIYRGMIHSSVKWDERRRRMLELGYDLKSIIALERMYITAD